jgi:hypothetical protein
MRSNNMCTRVATLCFSNVVLMFYEFRPQNSMLKPDPRYVG